jgi:hypothetical protein
MQSSLLLWDQLYTIVPFENYAPSYGHERDMATAWELIGRTLVPNESQQKRAHTAIETTLKAGIPGSLYHVGKIDQPQDVYEIWPQKFSDMTWQLMRQHGLTDLPLENGDYPFTQEGGLLVMAKLADACAGTAFARVTDRLMAYGMIGTDEQRPASERDVIPVTLDLVDATSIPLEKLIEFRRREQRERRGSDYTKLRQSYADAVQAHVTALGEAADQFQRDELNREFRERMKIDLKDLRDELGTGRFDFVLKPVVMTAVVTGAALVGHAAVGAALAVGALAGVGANSKEIGKTVADFLSDRLKFSRGQKDVMAKHPMAYMYSLSKN